MFLVYPSGAVKNKFSAPSNLLLSAYPDVQVATLIAVYAHISFAYISGIGWGWAGVIWLYSLIFYIPLDIIKFMVRYALSGEAWNLLFDRKVSTIYPSPSLLAAGLI